jgi:tRNA (cytidine/uridine-2'-O-)-methyltransferase
MMRIALYQPEIAGNMGAILRLAACFGVGVDVIEPCGFIFSDAKLRRAGMDYIDRVAVVRHPDWDSFRAIRTGRLILLTTKGAQSLYDTRFAADDILMMGSESAGVPESVAAACDQRVRIPIDATARSFNLSVATGIAIAEGLRQTGGLPQC